MEGYTYVQLRVNLPIVQEIKDFQMVQTVGEHTRCVVSGVIEVPMSNRYLDEIDAEKEIEVFLEGGPILFKGLIEEISITSVGELYSATIQAISYTAMLDAKKVSRSFQDSQRTYSSLIKEVVQAYPSGDIIDKASEGATIDHLIVQYQETDWQFLKRLASHFNQNIVPISTYTGAKIIFGDNKRMAQGLLENNAFKMTKNLKAFKEASENTFEVFDEHDSMMYEVDSLENFEIGNQVSYQQRALYIHTKTIVLEEGLLRFYYKLSTERGMGQTKKFNETIKGVSLKGKVLEVVRDQVKVHLEIDEGQDVGKAWCFPYTTKYTAEGQSGWYVMPEKGDTVAIYFPSHEEQEAMGINALRIGDKQTDKIDNPQIKYFRTIDGKELKFAPNEIMITCINGKDPKNKEEKVIYIKLNEQTGIEIMSTEPITFKSDQGISFEAEGSMEIKAKKQIKLRCKQSEIRMDDMIDIRGPEVRIN